MNRAKLVLHRILNFKSYIVTGLFLCLISSWVFAEPAKENKNQLLVSNKTLIKNFYTDVWTKGQKNKVYQYVSDDVTGNINGNKYDLSGLMQRIDHFDSTSTGISAKVHELIAEGDRVAVFVTICSTTKKTKQRYCVPNLGLYTIRGNKIVSLITTSPVPTIYQFKPTTDK